MNNFYLKQIKQQNKEEELLCFLQYNFGEFHQFKFDDKANISAFVYSTSNNSIALDVSLGKNGKIGKIMSYLSTKDTKKLESSIQDVILSDHGNKIGQVICFINGKVEKW